MSDGKDARGFFRRVVNFVVNPRAEPADSRSSELDLRDSEFARSELKAMIERKRRNDFVRKRELDLLRKLRREGLTPEQLAVLGSSSGMADTETRADEPGLVAEPGMKARIDEIEQQMAAHVISRPHRQRCRRSAQPPRRASRPRSATGPSSTSPTPLRAAWRTRSSMSRSSTKCRRRPHGRRAASASAPAPASPMSRYDTSAMESEVEVTEFDHDPDLDEAVIGYANGDFAQAESLLAALIRKGGSRRDHPETWMVIFDLYRATGQQPAFEALAVEFAERFSQSAPHWFSVPKMVADAASENRPSASRIDGECELDLSGAHRRRGGRRSCEAARAMRRCRGSSIGPGSSRSIRTAAGRSSRCSPSGYRRTSTCAGSAARCCCAGWPRRRRWRTEAWTRTLWQLRLRRAADGEPPGTFRRGGDRLLRDLRDLAPVVGAVCLPGAHQRSGRCQHAGRNDLGDRRCRARCSSSPNSRPRAP